MGLKPIEFGGWKWIHRENGNVRMVKTNQTDEQTNKQLSILLEQNGRLLDKNHKLKQENGKLKSENAALKEQLQYFIPRRRVRRVYKLLKIILEDDKNIDDKINARYYHYVLKKNEEKED